MDNNDAIHTDAPASTTYDSIDDAADAFLSRWTKDADKPSEKAKESTDTDEVEDEVEDTEEGSETEDEAEDVSEDQDDSDEDSDAAEAKYADDDFKTKIKVGDEELEVSVKDLKRLYGQEAALTRKSQEVAAKRTQLEQDGARYVAATESLLGRAYERFAPYQNIDWPQAAATLDPEEYNALKTAATTAYNDVQFLSSELDTFMGQVQAQRFEALKNEAKQTIAELSDPNTGIKGFNEQMYLDMRSFAVSQGIPESAMDTLVSAPALRMIHAAMMYHKGKSAETTKVTKTPKKVIKSSTNIETTRKATNPRHDQQAMNKLRKSGSVDDAAEAFLSRWRDK